jgi:hypothetical protein
MSVYCPEKYVNIIREKRKPRKGLDGSEQLNFPDWQQAHAWLVSIREKQLSRASLEMDRARRSLAKARAMKPATEEATQQ